MALKIALFVEGSFGIPHRSLSLPHRALWCETIAPCLGLPAPDDVIPISKSHLARLRANDPTPQTAKRPAISGSGEALDQLMRRWMLAHPFDVAIVAWDLIPRLNHLTETCRWEETLELYRLLGLSSALSQPWPERARLRFDELAARARPGARATLPEIEPGTILAVCMEPMFEGLFADDKALKNALQMRGVTSRLWPKQWDRDRPDRDLVGPAIAAAQTARVKLPVRGGFQQAKDEWGAFLFRAMIADPEYGPRLREHALVRRLREVLRLP
jgi:hypothetical protein